MRSFQTYVNEKAGNGTVNLYKRDGQGGYTAKDHDCAKAHPGKSHKAWAKKEEAEDYEKQNSHEWSAKRITDRPQGNRFFPRITWDFFRCRKGVSCP